jgi:hypothetical protein
VLIGLQLYDADPPSMRRQRRAVQALRALDGVRSVNLQFRTGPPSTCDGIETVAALDCDSEMATGVRGRRRPLTRELFDVLAGLAAKRGLEYFAFINSDIIVTRGAIAAVRATRRQTYAISRTDVDDTSSPGSPDATLLTAGQDMFVVAVSWWRQHGRRFRPYIVGEMCWDDVYTATMMCHSDGLLLNRDPLILHERHPAVWHETTPAARYNGMMAALDARYFSIWCEYWKRLDAARARGASAEEEARLRDEMLVWRPSGLEATRQVARMLRARLRYWRVRREWVA